VRIGTWRVNPTGTSGGRVGNGVGVGDGDGDGEVGDGDALGPTDGAGEDVGLGENVGVGAGEADCEDELPDDTALAGDPGVATPVWAHPATTRPIATASAIVMVAGNVGRRAGGGIVGRSVRVTVRKATPGTPLVPFAADVPQ